MLDAGVDVNAADPDGMTPLHRACIENYLNIASVLVTRGASVTVSSKPPPPRRGEYPGGRGGGGRGMLAPGTQTLAAASLARIAWRDAHWECGVVCGGVQRQDNDWWTPLHAAASGGNWRICNLLFNNGADPLAVNAEGDLPLDLVADAKVEGIIQKEMEAKVCALVSSRLTGGTRWTCRVRDPRLRCHIGHVSWADGLLWRYRRA
jgi:ankyrin repeat protein